MLSFVPDCCQFLAISHQEAAFARIGAIEAENLVIRAGNQRFLRSLSGLLFCQMRMRFLAHNREFVVLRRRHLEAAALAVDRASEGNFVALILGDRMIAAAAGIEVAGAMLLFYTRPE